MNLPSTPRARGRRPLLYSAVAGGALLSGIAACLALSGPAFAGAPQAARVAPSASWIPSPLPGSIAQPPLESKVGRGRVVDSDTGLALRGVSVRAGHTEVLTDTDGWFNLDIPSPESSLVMVKTPGYERKRLVLSGAETTIKLRPQVIRAAYLTYYGVGERKIRDRVLDLVGRTELNAVVIDVKGDRGLIPYRTEVPAALEAGAQGR
jgi:hypothetical protein